MRLELLDVSGVVIVRRIGRYLEFVGESISRLERPVGDDIRIQCNRGRRSFPQSPLRIEYSTENCSKASLISRLEISGQSASVLVNDVEFDPELAVRLRARGVQLNFLHCHFSSLQLDSSQSEQSGVELCSWSPVLKRLEAQLEGTALSSVQLAGGNSWSTSRLSRSSALSMLVMGSLEESRTVEFWRDSSSKVTVHMPGNQQTAPGCDFVQRGVQAPYERWTLDPCGLSNIEFEEQRLDAMEEDTDENCQPLEDACSVCYRQQSSVTLLPCQHRCLCRGCLQQMLDLNSSKALSCPLCRSESIRFS